MSDGSRINLSDPGVTPEVIEGPGQARAFTSVRPKKGGPVTIIEVMAVLLSLAWLIMMGAFFLGLGAEESQQTRTDPLTFMVTVLGVFLPVALIWLAAAAARTTRAMREESHRLQAAIDAMRLSYVDHQQKADLSLKRSMEERIEGVAKAQAFLGAEVASLHATQKPVAVLNTPPRPGRSLPEPQAVLALEDAKQPEALSAEEFIRALNFPDNERDKEGFRVLRKALEHHPTAQLVSAAQDVLTLLSQDGIYMDDFAPHHADPAIWRAFAEGIRNEAIQALGGIRDRSGLALTQGRMKDDPDFRDAVRHFIRTFDKVFVEFAARASDLEIARFSNTRTARAFMLTGRVAGSFDAKS